VLDIIERLDSCDVVGPLAAACLLSCGAVICMMFSRPIAKTAEFSLLVGAQLIGALVQAEYLYAWMAGPVDNSPDGSGGRFGRSTAFEVWLGQFSSFGTSLYFLTLSTQLLRTTLSPFNIGSTLGYHVATCSFAAALAAAAAHFERDVDTGGTRPGSAFLPDAETGRWILVGFRTAIYALALAMLVYSWRLILYGVQGDAAFTQRRRILTLALASILLSEAIFGLFPPLVPPILKYGLDLSDDVASCSTTILLGLQDVALASTWLVVFSCSERALRTARMRDTVSLEDGFVPEGAGDLSAALRSQLVSLITVGACRSARDMRDECGTGAGAMSPAACAADGEYRRVVPLARFEPPGALGRQMPVQVSSLAPRVFHELRRLAGVSTDDYVQSLSGEKTERFTEGRSGALAAKALATLAACSPYKPPNSRHKPAFSCGRATKPFATQGRQTSCQRAAYPRLAPPRLSL
jgi:energy-converting hydrogenase Eha subunit C